MAVLSKIFNVEFAVSVEMEEVLKFLIDSGYLHDSQYLYHALVAMGANPVLTHDAVQKLMSLRLDPIQGAAMQGWSFSDPALSFIDTRPVNLEQFVFIQKVGKPGSHKLIESVFERKLRDYGTLLFLTDPHLRQVRISITPELSEWAAEHFQELA